MHIIIPVKVPFCDSHIVITSIIVIIISSIVAMFVVVVVFREFLDLDLLSRFSRNNDRNISTDKYPQPQL